MMEDTQTDTPRDPAFAGKADSCVKEDGAKYEKGTGETKATGDSKGVEIKVPPFLGALLASLLSDLAKPQAPASLNFSHNLSGVIGGTYIVLLGLTGTAVEEKTYVAREIKSVVFWDGRSNAKIWIDDPTTENADARLLCDIDPDEERFFVSHEAAQAEADRSNERLAEMLAKEKAAHDKKTALRSRAFSCSSSFIRCT